ncbi:folylpolyglutamate synthase/dihydrofolate synthase family protein [Aminivibrio sp.]|jgi:dihydrofolate synthase/folylpolyglutamate synthase|uniref:bifunctional folylpolyglutamate synthase/dihydrofolate synthase n=1 Tax=Aminivibrio sp. TaxID=1872489 RepID=UPI001A57A5EF|nr:folylpolyglutamate synthase/dihydrofolate synthase family protein [Aminivibrio sp.]MBL3540601.1 bifunctional folylpolyglutamate synthase/dihydrofolate synthase [Aminivibrio sp.]MDK2958818.1 dihydrofolate synthase / folylpolyglutamate synthase [Synergistaceae bacterium]
MNRKAQSFEELETVFASLASAGIRPGLDRISRLMEKLGNPEKDFPAVHIVGTNGKGSTAAFSDSILREAGYRTALYTSPHLESPAERLLIDGSPLTILEWAEAAESIAQALEEDAVLRSDPPTFFELVTAAAFLLCSRNRTEIAVVEAGLGGRLDATNLLGNVILTFVTSISMDHMEFLGDSLEKIAGEKFAVMREGVPAFFSGSPSGLVSLFLERARASSALPHVLTEEVRLEDVSVTAEGTAFSLLCGGGRYPIRTPLRGSFQVENCSLAAAGMLGISGRYPRITGEALLRGAEKVRWPGRFEILRADPPLVLDGGHNPDGIMRLVESLRAIYGEKKPTVVFACMKDKDFPADLSLLLGCAGRLICTSVPGNPRAADPCTLAQTAKSVGWKEDAVGVFPDPLDALKAAERTGRGTVCCGSLYFIGWMRPLIFSRREELLF